MSKLSHVIKLSLFLFAVWLLLSGHYTPLLLGLGVMSSLLVVLLAVRVDHSRYADSRWYSGSGIYRDVELLISA